MRRSLLLSLLLFLCAVPFVRAAMPGPGMPVPAPVVEVGEVLAVQDTRSRRYTGRVVSPATVSLVPRVAGEILEVGFRDGDTVQAGQMLYRIDPVRYEAAVKNARGKVVQYKAEHAYARADLARNRSLFKKQAVSRDVLESAERTEQVAYGELLAAEADLVTAQDDLRNTRIVAPMAGRIGVTAFTAGNYVTTSSGTLVTLVRTDPVRVRFGLSVRDMQAVFGSEEELRSLGRVRVRLADGTDYGTEGRVTIVDNTAEGRTDTIQVYAELANPQSRLVPESTVVVTLYRQTDSLVPESTVVVTLYRQTDSLVPAVPPSAVQHDAQGAFVYVVQEDDRVSLHRVTLGNLVGESQTVRSGLTVHERVVTDGTHKVADGMKVDYARKGADAGVQD